MMRKIFLSLVIALLTVTSSFAGDLKISDWLDKIPNLNQAVIFSLDDYKFEYATTVTLASFLKDDIIKLDVGYTPTQKALALVSVKLVNVGDYIKFPILDLIQLEPFIYGSVDRIAIGFGNAKDNNEFGYGIGAKIISIKF